MKRWSIYNLALSALVIWMILSIAYWFSGYDKRRPRPAIPGLEQKFEYRAAMDRAGRISNFEVRKPPADREHTFTLLKNGKGTEIVCTIKPNETFCIDRANVVQFDAGDEPIVVPEYVAPGEEWDGEI